MYDGQHRSNTRVRRLYRRTPRVVLEILAALGLFAAAMLLWVIAFTVLVYFLLKLMP